MKYIFERFLQSNVFRSRLIIAIFLIGLIYLLYPNPKSITQIPPLPGSTKSNLEGDTIQNPNIAAYFSNYNRAFITNFYKSYFKKTIPPFLNLPLVSLNHPPEEAYKYVRDQQESTFLEEYSYPLRGTLYVNGYEPITANIISHATRSYYGDRVGYQQVYYLSKTTLRYYPTSVVARVLIYFGIWGLGYALARLFMMVIKE